MVFLSEDPAHRRTRLCSARRSHNCFYYRRWFRWSRRCSCSRCPRRYLRRCARKFRRCSVRGRRQRCYYVARCYCKRVVSYCRFGRCIRRRICRRRGGKRLRCFYLPCPCRCRRGYTHRCFLNRCVCRRRPVRYCRPNNYSPCWRRRVCWMSGKLKCFIVRKCLCKCRRGYKLKCFFHYCKCSRH